MKLNIYSGQPASPLIDDGQEHNVEVIMGDPEDSRPSLNELPPNNA
jgi:hypothetical protein